MATEKCIPPTVQESQRVLSGVLAEAADLIDLARAGDGYSPFANMALRTLERLMDACDQLEHQLAKHGVPSFDERFHTPGGVASLAGRDLAELGLFAIAMALCSSTSRTQY
ncbi:hypothetical protein SAMN05216344_112121 [Polaromonas sp. OV174]|uniref:hypothetical protein n=1 Tax=Polaromonas sp. OV174 TaxID=1855300 RepID=UPI0008EB4107|nr:hypothetical protein [Polaromonas sp. OV174]SFC26390.1 hypothetical protein SAMN05216344_112121 [Polaromonas sp. OV174]